MNNVAKSDDKARAIRTLEAVGNQGVAQAPRPTRLRRRRFFLQPSSTPIYSVSSLRLVPNPCERCYAFIGDGRPFPNSHGHQSLRRASSKRGAIHPLSGSYILSQAAPRLLVKMAMNFVTFNQDYSYLAVGELPERLSN